jgi:hypothetical protein
MLVMTTRERGEAAPTNSALRDHDRSMVIGVIQIILVSHFVVTVMSCGYMGTGYACSLGTRCCVESKDTGDSASSERSYRTL